MDTNIQCPRLCRLVLVRLLPARCPRAQSAQPTGVFPADGGLLVVPSLVLRVVEDPYTRVDFADDLLGVGVDIFPVPIGEVSLCLPCPEVSLARLRSG